MKRVMRRARAVEVLQFDGTTDGAHRLAAFTAALTRGPAGLVLATARGALRVEPGDWLVRDPETLEVAIVGKAQFFRDFDHVGVAEDVA